MDTAGNLFIMDAFNYRVRKVSTSGIITTLANVVGWALAVDAESNVFVTAPGDGNLGATGVTSKISANGTVTAGSSIGGWGLAVDHSGNLFVADGKASVQKVSPDGTVTIIAGNGKAGYSGDGGPASSTQFSNPPGVAVDSNGDLFIADRFNYRVRKVSTSGVVATVAGNGTGRYFSGGCSSSRYAAPAADAGPATSAQLSYPLGVAVDRDGNLFVADTADNRTRKVSPSGIITTVAGSGSCGFSGDGGPASGAQFYSPVGVAADGAGNLGSRMPVTSAFARCPPAASSAPWRVPAWRVSQAMAARPLTRN